MHSRRVFLGSSAALGLVGAATMFRVKAQDHDHRSSDPVVAALQQELLESVKMLAAGIHGGEPARRMASALRVAAAAGVAREFDARLRAAVRRQGRDELLRRPIELTRLEAELRKFGVEAPPLRMPTYAESAAALERLADRGVASLLSGAIGQFMEMGTVLDRQRGGIAQVALQEDQCESARRELTAIETMMIVACLFAELDFGMACFFLSGVYIGMRVGLCLRGCC